MARRGKHRSRLNWTVILLVAVVVAFCLLTSLEDKLGLEIGLPDIELPSLGFLFDYLEEFTAGDGGDRDSTDQMDNALAVSGPVSGDGLTVHMISMGQADSILVQGPKKTVLIDAGENGQGEQVISFLKSQGVKNIDILIGTHPHSDHIGGMDTVVQQFPVKEIVLPELPDEVVPTTKTYTDLLEAIADKGLGITPAVPGKSFDLGDNAVLTIMAPLAEHNDLNNMSVVSHVQYGGTSFLLTGDASAASESLMVERGGLTADVLQAGHHGSNSSSTEAFLDAVQPRVAIISCGLDNSYGHPHREVLERLQARGIQVYRTDLNGTISVYSDGERVYISTEQ